MVGSLSCFHLAILLFQFILNVKNILIKTFTLLVHGPDQFCDGIILRLCLFQNGLLFFLFALKTKYSLADLRFPDIRLLHHGIKSLRFSPGIGAAVEDFNDLILSFLNRLRTDFDVLPGILKFFLFLFQAALNLF